MINPTEFRNVLGAYPTGVCVVTATDAEGNHHALTVGSFTSISLEPPLVGFFPAKSSSTWPKIAAIGSFCVNVLAGDQGAICQQMAGSAAQRFSDVDHSCGQAGHPILADVQAWIECSLEREIEIGDHLLVVGAVMALLGRDDGGALVFHRRKYLST